MGAVKTLPQVSQFADGHGLLLHQRQDLGQRVSDTFDERAAGGSPFCRKSPGFVWKRASRMIGYGSGSRAPSGNLWRSTQERSRARRIRLERQVRRPRRRVRLVSSVVLWKSTKLSA